MLYNNYYTASSIIIIVIQQYKPKNAGTRQDPSLLVEYMIQGHVQYAGGRCRPEGGPGPDLDVR
jgi:hypothetical protein